MVRKFAAIVMLLVLLCPAALAEPEGVTTARAGVVHFYGVGTDRDTGQRIRWTGSGIAVGQAGEETDTFLTNWHVATGSGRCEEDSMKLWILEDNAKFGLGQEPLEGSATECTVLSTTDGYPDVAVVRSVTPIPGSRALPLLSSRRLVEGTTVYALGFAGLQNVASSGDENVQVTEGTVTDHLIMTKAGNTRAVIHSAPIQHGYSGGPLVTEDGTVVAENTYGFEDNVTSQLFCAVYTDYGMKLLDELNIAYTRAEGRPYIAVLMANLLHQPALSDGLAYVLFAVGMIAILAFVLYFIKTAREAFRELRERRKRPPEEIEKEV